MDTNSCKVYEIRYFEPFLLWSDKAIVKSLLFITQKLVIKMKKLYTVGDHLDVYILFYESVKAKN